MSVRIFKLSMPFLVAGLAPMAAFAHDDDVDVDVDVLPTPAVTVTETETDHATPAATTTTTTTLPSTAAPATGAPALAVDDDDDEGLIKDAAFTPAGVYGFVGGGATNFTQSEANGATQAGGYWDARVGIGTRSILGGEVAYVGSARDIQALGAGSEAFLMSNGVEGIARVNAPLTPGSGQVLVEPYGFGGIGWNRYNVVSDVSLSADVTNEDDIMTVPMGVGLAFGYSGVTLDTRATYRQAIGSDLLGSESSSFGDSSLNSWAAGAALGFEF